MLNAMNHIFCLFVLILTGCSVTHTRNTDFAVETVMHEGMSIVATNNLGTMEIKAEKGFSRCYTWEGATRCQVLEPRKERWAGKLGIYHSKLNNHWENHNTITNANLEEAQVHFKTTDEAMKFVRHRSRLDGDTVYNDSGLVVTWKKSIHPQKQEGNVITVNVWQVLINGDKPNKLTGSQNSKIMVQQ